jgi:hypothetical protein
LPDTLSVVHFTEKVAEGKEKLGGDFVSRLGPNAALFRQKKIFFGFNRYPVLKKVNLVVDI